MARFSKRKFVVAIALVKLVIYLFRIFIVPVQDIESCKTGRKKSAWNIRSIANSPREKINTTISSQQNLLQNITKPFYSLVEDTVFNPIPIFFTRRHARVNNIPRNFPVVGSSICKGGCPRALFVIPCVANISTVKIKPRTGQAVITNNAKWRLSIRTSWASDLYDKHWRQRSSNRLAFFFGSSGLEAKDLEILKSESALYGDIVVGDFKDTYQNLSLKMAVAITWIAQFCPNVEAVIKVDMDTFVNVNLLLSLVRKLPSSTHPNFVLGHKHYATHPPVSRKGTWFVPESLYPYPEFPKYLYGHSYVISGPAVRLMAESIPFFPLVPNEDAFMTGILPVVLNINRFHHGSFVNKKNITVRTFCDMVHNIYVSAFVYKRWNRAKLWKFFKTGNCSAEDVRR